jgi:hypothetical protein
MAAVSMAMQRMDADGDGVVDLQEFEAAVGRQLLVGRGFA